MTTTARASASDRAWWAQTRLRCARYRVYYQPGITRASVWAKTGGHCYICGYRIASAWHVDHVFPLSRGGSHTYHNLAPAHAGCNRAKGATVLYLPEGPEAHATAATVIVWKRLASLPGRRAMRCGFGPFSVAPRTIICRLKPPTGSVKAARLEAEEIRTALDDNAARVFVDGRWLAIEIANPYPREVDLSLLSPRGLVIPIGTGADERVVAVDFGQTPHLALFGQTGSGKSVALETLVWGITKAGHELVLADTACVAWREYTDLAALAAAVPRSRAEVTALLERTVTLMQDRKPGTWDRRIFVVIDEVGREPNQDATGLEPRGMAHLVSLLANARKAGMHIIWADQRPVAERVPKTALDNTTAKIGLRLGAASTSHHALGVAGAELLLGRGDALMVQPRGSEMTATRFQVAMIPPDMWRQIPRGEAPPPIDAPGQEARERADDTLILEHARAAGITTAGGVMQLARRLSLGETGKGIGWGRAQRIAANLTGSPASGGVRGASNV